MGRAKRKMVAWLCMSALLLLQLAAAAHACPAPAIESSRVLAFGTSGIPPRQGMDEQLPNLCEHHCLQGSQSVDTQPLVALDRPALPLLAVVAHPKVHVPLKPRSAGALLITVVNPPPLIRFGVLRI
jgi:hypothetical protein